MRFGDKEGRHLTDYCQALNSFHIPHHKGEIITVSLLPKKHQHSRPQYFLFFFSLSFHSGKEKGEKKNREVTLVSSLWKYLQKKRRKKNVKCKSAALKHWRCCAGISRERLSVWGGEILSSSTLSQMRQRRKNQTTLF